MSNPNYTHIVLLVDASGSMQNTKQATIDGVNAFIESQKHLPELADRNLSLSDDFSDSTVSIKCTMTLAVFSTGARSSTFATQTPSETNGEPQEPYHYAKLCEAQDIMTAPLMTNENYYTVGGTPLIDAFYKTITDCSGFISRLPEDEKPGRIIIVSITDGEENSSQKHTRSELKKLTQEKTALNWQFIYLGANQDAFSESEGYGIARGQSLNYVQDSAGITKGFTSLASNTLMKRMASVDTMKSCCISDYDTSAKPATVASPGNMISDSTASTISNAYLEDMKTRIAASFKADKAKI